MAVSQTWSGPFGHHHHALCLECGATSHAVNGAFFVGCQKRAALGTLAASDVARVTIWTQHMGQPEGATMRVRVSGRADQTCPALAHFHQTFFV